MKAEYIRLKELEKQLAEYDYFERPLQVGFDYGKSAILKPDSVDAGIPKVDRINSVTMGLAEWGFIPTYIRNRDALVKMRFGYKDDKGQFKPPMITLNAVSEEILAPNKIFRDAALHRRCLVISSGFFEWKHVYPLNKRTGQPLKTATKYPYHIKLKDKEYFFMAGIWQPWTDKETGEYVESFAILTTKANSLMEEIHNSKKRMPTILTEDLAYEWLFGELDEKRISELAGFQIPSEEMEAWTIRKDFREVPEPTERFEYS